MIPNYDVWQTMYEENYKKKRFLYHYTNINKAFIILSEEKIKFSKLNLMNDTLEAKPKISFKLQNDSKLFDEITNHFSYTNNNYLQLLCLSQDVSVNLKTDDNRILYSDYSGRGFALPRMWAQYGDNNNGVCFIFDREKLTALIKHNILAGLIKSNNVKYISHFKPLDLNMDNVIEYVRALSGKSEIERNINDFDFLRTYDNFVEYNYFSKLDDWKGENEYRFLAYGDKDYYIPNIFEAIVGIVVGEAISNSNIKIISLLNKNNCEIMKITFNWNGCSLKNIYEED